MNVITKKQKNSSRARNQKPVYCPQAPRFVNPAEVSSAHALALLATLAQSKASTEEKGKTEPSWTEQELMEETGIAKTFASKILAFCDANEVDLDSGLWEVAAGPAHLAKLEEYSLEYAEKRCEEVRADIEAGTVLGFLYARNGFFVVA